MATARKQPRDQDLYEARVHDEAVAWTAFVQVAPRDRRRVDADSKDAAIAAGQQLARETGRAALIYAIDAANHDVMIGTVTRAGDYVSAVRLR